MILNDTNSLITLENFAKKPSFYEVRFIMLY